MHAAYFPVCPAISEVSATLTQAPFSQLERAYYYMVDYKGPLLLFIPHPVGPSFQGPLRVLRELTEK